MARTYRSYEGTDNEPTRPLIDPIDGPIADDRGVVRTVAYVQPRKRWPGVLAAMFIGAAVAAIVVSNFYDPRSAGEKLDAATAAVGNKVDDLKTASVGATGGGAQVAERAADAIGDAGITAKVKTALAADPRLSALKIDVKTNDGIVSLDGPAPDVKSKERAEILAAAPEGVIRVDNRLVVTQ